MAVIKRNAVYAKLQGRGMIPGDQDSPKMNPWGTILEIFSNKDTSITYGNNLLHWKTKIRNRENATTTMQVSGYRMQTPNDGYAYYTYRRKSNGKIAVFSEMQGNFGIMLWNQGLNLPDSGTLNTTRVDNQALSKFIERAKSEQRAFQGGVFIGELRETIEMIRHPLRLLYDYQFAFLRSINVKAKGIRRRGIKNRAERATSVARLLSGARLQYKFGVAPLVNDIADAVKAAQRMSIRDTWAPTVPIRARAEERIQTPVTATTGNTLPHVKMTYELAQTYERRMYGAVKVSNDWNGVAGNLGVGLSDFAPTIWELIPWSFLADYFLNIQSIIEALSFNKSSVAWCNTGTKKERSYTLNSAVITDAPLTPASQFFKEERSIRPGTFFLSRVDLRRDPFADTFIPTLEFTIPGGSGKWLNMAALLGQSRATSRTLSKLLK